MRFTVDGGKAATFSSASIATASSSVASNARDGIGGAHAPPALPTSVPVSVAAPSPHDGGTVAILAAIAALGDRMDGRIGAVERGLETLVGRLGAVEETVHALATRLR